MVIAKGLLVGVIRGVGTGFESELTPRAGHAILVHPRTPFVQKQLLQELSPVSFPVQPLWTVSLPVSLHTACVVLGVFGSGADKVPETFARMVASTARSWASRASTVASISRVGSTTAVASILGVGSAGTGVTVEQASTKIPISNARTTVSFIPLTL